MMLAAWGGAKLLSANGKAKLTINPSGGWVGLASCGPHLKKVLVNLLQAAARSGVEALLGNALVLRIAARARSRQVLVLAYHNIVPAGSDPGGDRSLHLDFDRFRRQLDLLGRQEVIPLERMWDPGRGRPRVAITFDDAYRGAVMLGLPELAARGLPVTMFVAPGRLGGQSFWWDTLAGPGGLSESFRRRALTECCGREAAVGTVAGMLGLRPSKVPSELESATEPELSQAAGLKGITLGAHSWSHPNLAAIEGVALDEELARPLEWLRRYPNMLPWLAYPYGLDSPAVRRAAAEAGYKGALRIAGGWFTPGRVPSPYAIPRLNLPAGLSQRGLALRLAGLVP